MLSIMEFTTPVDESGQLDRRLLGQRVHARDGQGEGRNREEQHMAREKATSINSSQKVSVREKICYFLVTIGNAPITGLISSYFLIFYTDVVGLDAGALGTLLLVSKVVDAISDPIMGYLIDRIPATKHGKFRPLIIIGTIICSINYVLVWFGAVWAPVGKYIVVYATYMLLGWSFDIMDIPFNSMLPVITTDKKERSTLSTIRAFGLMVGYALIYVVAPFIVAESTLANYYTLVFGSVAIVLVCSIVGALGLKEHGTDAPGKKEKDDAESRYSIKEMLRILTMPPVLSYLLAALIYAIANSVYNGTLTYYFTYVMGDLTLSSTVSIITGLFTPVDLILVTPISNKLGHKRAYIFGICASVIGRVMCIFAPTSVPMFCVSSAIAGLGSMVAIANGYSCLADATTYVQYKTGKHAEASVSSFSSFINKCSSGIGSALPAYILAWTGYEAGVEVQNASVINGLIGANTVIPAIIYTVAVVIMAAGYKLSQEEVDQMSAEIAEREAM